MQKQDRHDTRRVTLADVAQHAGVSKATASLVLRNVGSLQASTRERVKHSMSELGYVYHRGAASMRARRTFTVGLVVPDLSNPFTAELAIGTETALGEDGLVTLMSSSFEDPALQKRLISSILERQVDGLVLFPALGTEGAAVDAIVKTGVPVVIAVRNLRPGVADYVGIDNVASGMLAADHLLEHGCTRLAFVGGYEELLPRQERMSGIRKALARHPEASLVRDLTGPATGTWARGVVDDLFSDSPGPDGIVCQSDVVAFGLYRGLRDTRPGWIDKIRVVSHDDVAEAALWEPPLTSVSANGRDVGLRCAEVLVKRIASPEAPAEQVLLTPQLVVRSSCSCG